MTPMQNSQCSHLPPSEGSQGRFDLHSFPPVYEASSFPCAIFCSPCQGDPRENDHLQQEAHEQFPSSGSTWHSGRPTSPPITKDDESRRKNNSTFGKSVIPSKSGSVHWVSSKMKIVRRVMDPDWIANSKPGEGMLQAQDQQQSVIDNDRINNNSHSPPSGVIRVCSDCNTTKTPLWRSGPRGPKSLCNACGIRQRKARRAIAAAAGLIPAVMPAKQRKEKVVAPDGERTMPFKKRCKFTLAQTTKDLHFDDFAALSLSKTSALQRVFPQDEKDAAILLMALSCGLIRG